MEERMTRERAVWIDLPLNPFSRRKAVAGYISELGAVAPAIFFLGRVDLVMAVERVTGEGPIPITIQNTIGV